MSYSPKRCLIRDGVTLVTLKGHRIAVTLGQIKEPFRTQMYKAYNLNGATTASWTKQRLLGYDRVQL